MIVRPVATPVAQSVAQSAGRELPLLEQLQLAFAGDEWAIYNNNTALMFQEAAGITPVTSIGDPIGLWLDQSQGVDSVDEYGPELVTNGTFDANIDGWDTIGTGAELISWNASGALDFDGNDGGAYGGTYFEFGTEIGEWYLTSVEVTALDGAISLRDLDSNDPLIITEPGTYTRIGRATATTSKVAVRSNNDSNRTFTIDNVSVKKLTRTLTGLGPESVSNGDFATGDFTGWIDDEDHWAVVSGKAYHASTSTFSMLRTDISEIPDGATIKIEFDLDYISGSANVRVQFRDADGSPSDGGSSASKPWGDAGALDAADNGRVSGIFTKPAGAVYIAWARDRSTGDTAEFSIDNISVREIPGNHAKQSTSPARPEWDGSAVVGDATDDWLDTGFIQTENTLNIAIACKNKPTASSVLAGHGESANSTRAFIINPSDNEYAIGWMDDFQSSDIDAVAGVVQILSGNADSAQLFVNNQQLTTTNPAAINLSGLPTSIFATNTSSGPALFSDVEIAGLCIMQGRKWTHSERQLITNYLSSLL